MAVSPLLEVRDVARRYAGRAAVDAASFDLRAGRVASLLGPSGCGKSTLLRMIAGLEPVDEGEIRIDGKPVSSRGLAVPPEDRGVGLVFQDNALFPHLDVSDNIGFGLKGLAPAERHSRVDSLLRRFQIAHLASAWPHQLSGGEQQRVAIARAMAREPSLLLLDEPFSSLDGHLRAQVRRSLLADLRDTGTTVLVVTHDPDEAMMMADDLILMSEGRILQVGSSESCYRRPVSAAAARLLGEAIVLSASVAGGLAQTVLGSVPAAGLPDGPAEIILRPEALRLGEGASTGVVEAVRFGGSGYVVDLTVGDQRFSIRHPDNPSALGDVVRLGIAPGAGHILASDASADRVAA